MDTLALCTSWPNIWPIWSRKRTRRSRWGCPRKRTGWHIRIRSWTRCKRKRETSSANMHLILIPFCLNEWRRRLKVGYSSFSTSSQLLVYYFPINFIVNSIHLCSSISCISNKQPMTQKTPNFKKPISSFRNKSINCITILFTSLTPSMNIFHTLTIFSSMRRRGMICPGDI